MRLFASAVVALLACSAALAGHIEGGVIARVTTGGTSGSYPWIFSTGDAEYIGPPAFNPYFPDYDRLYGTHQIFHIETRSFEETDANYFGHVEGPGQIGRCYSASLSADVNILEVNGNTWFATACVPDEQTYDPWCDAYCWTACQNNTCPQNPGSGETVPGCPLMIDLDGNGLRLTGVDDGVAFDLIPDGHPERTAWTTDGVLDAFLVLDRNSNGTIESGAELFGNFTLLSSGSHAPDGFIALAQYDSPAFGGNRDSRIDSTDAIFTSLRLWTDVNHDGVAQADELLALASAGLVAFELDYVASRHRDAHGNEFRFKGRAWKTGNGDQTTPAQMYDVFLVHRSP